MTKTGQKRKNAVLGLDIGSHAVKAVEIVRTGHRLTVTNCAIADVPGDDPESRSGAVASVLKKGKFRAKTVAIGCAGRGTLLRQVSIPSDFSDDLGEAVRLEAQKHLTYNPDDACIDYYLDPHQHGRNIGVLLAAVRRSDVDGTMAMLSEAGAAPDAYDFIIDMEAVALANALETLTLAGFARPGSPLCIVDFGATKTLIVISDGSNHLFREFPFGGVKLTEMIAHRLGVTPDEAEKVKLRPADKMDIIKDAMYPGVEDLTAEIRSCLDKYRQLSGGREVVRTFVSGGLTAFSGIVRLMGKLIWTETTVFDPFRVFGAKSLDKGFLEDNTQRFSLAFGLACHARE